MTATTRLVGLILAVLGIVSYLGTGRTSITALIPAFFGVVFLLLAWVARNEAVRRHAMHVAHGGGARRHRRHGVALLRASRGTLDFARPAVLAQIVTVLLLAWYLGKGIKSFRDARRARTGGWRVTDCGAAVRRASFRNGVGTTVAVAV